MMAVDADTLLETVAVLDEQLSAKLRCQSRTHANDVVNHDPDEPATVRGYAPCGKTMNVCSKFAGVLSAAGYLSIRCKCGVRHFASEFNFINI